MLTKELKNQFPWKEVYAVLVVGIINIQLGLTMTFTAYVKAGVNGVNNLEETLDGSVSLMTAVFGSILLAYISDALGRKRSLQLVNLLFAVGSAIVYFYNTSNIMFYISRVITGIAMGGRPVTTLYISEVCNKNRRGRYCAFHGFLVVSGVMLTYLLQYLFPIQILAVVSSLVSWLGFIGLFFLPESQYFYALKDRKEKALHSAIWFDPTKTVEGIESEIEEIQEQESKKTKGSIWKILREVSHLKNVAITLMFFFTRTFCGREPMSVYPGNFISQLHSVYDVRIVTMVQSGFDLIICVFSTIFMDKCNRKTWLYFVGSTGTLSAGGLIICQFSNDFVNSTIPWIIPALYCMYASLIIGILFPLAALVACEIVSKSNEYRNMLYTFTWTINNLLRSLYTAAFPTLINDFNITYTLLLFVCSNLLLMAVTKFFVVETANKSLHKCIPEGDTSGKAEREEES